jgi:plastocyanin
MTQLKSTSTPIVVMAAMAILMAGAGMRAAQVEVWEATVGGESPDGSRQALAFLPNELWIHIGDSIRWRFAGDEIHTVTFLRSDQTRPPNYSATFGVQVGCGSPAITPDGSSFDGSSCINSGILVSGQHPSPGSVQTYTVNFPAHGNFKFVCLVHVDQTGVVHVLDPAETLPHDQNFYDREAQRQRAELLGDASRLKGRGASGDDDRAQSGQVIAGIGAIVTTTGGGSQIASVMRFLRDTIIVRIGETVEWTNLDPSIPHVVTFGAEPADPRAPSAGLTLDPDGARHAVVGSLADSVNSGTLPPAPQDRVGLVESPLFPGTGLGGPGTTRFRVTFTSPGTFNYICAIHDELGMKGTVIVYSSGSLR